MKISDTNLKYRSLVCVIISNAISIFMYELWTFGFFDIFALLCTGILRHGRSTHPGVARSLDQ